MHITLFSFSEASIIKDSDSNGKGCSQKEKKPLSY